MESNWSGIEYSFASFLLENGRYEEAAQIVETVERRHTQNGRRFNHEECGGTLLSCAGILGGVTVFDWSKGRYAQRKALLFRPPYPELTAPWFVPGAYGKLSIAEKENQDRVPGRLFEPETTCAPHRNGKSSGDGWWCGCLHADV